MQIHKRFTEEQVAVLLKGYCQGTIDRTTIEETLRIGKSRFFVTVVIRINFHFYTTENLRPDYPPV
jgi:hypothetical protein